MLFPRIWLIVSVGAMFLVETAALAGSMDQGMQYYQGGQYERACGCFLEEIRTNPSNARASYYLGNSYARLNRIPEAQGAYRRAMWADPNGSYGQSAQQAAAKLGTGDVYLLNPTPSAAAGTRKTDPNSKRLNSECEERVKEITQNGMAKIKKIESEMQDRINSNGQPVTVARSGGESSVSVYDPSTQNTLVRNDYAPQIQAVRDDMQKQINAVRAYYKSRMSN